jgi:hypothetical protein
VSPRLRTAPLREEHRLRVCENKLLRCREDVRGDWRQFYIVVHCNFFSNYEGLWYEWEREEIYRVLFGR